MVGLSHILITFSNLLAYQGAGCLVEAGSKSIKETIQIHNDDCDGLFINTKFLAQCCQLVLVFLLSLSNFFVLLCLLDFLCSFVGFFDDHGWRRRNTIVLFTGDSETDRKGSKVMRISDVPRAFSEAATRRKVVVLLPAETLGEGEDAKNDEGTGDDEGANDGNDADANGAGTGPVGDAKR